MQPEPGRLVEATRGRDRGLLFLVYENPGDGWVLLVDGKRRPLSRPKRKNVRHLRFHSAVAEDLAARWAAALVTTDAEVQEAIRRLAEKVREAG